VNGAPAEDAILLVRDGDGNIYAPRIAFARWRLKSPEGAAVEFEGETYLSLRAPGLHILVREETQRLEITAAPELLERVTLALDRGGPPKMSRRQSGMYLNYESVIDYADGDLSLNGAVEAVVFTRHGVGVSNFVGHWTEGRADLVRLETSWIIDNPEKMTSLRIGDGITRGGIGGSPLRFGGVQWSRNFSVRPEFVTLPMATISGSAAVPSVIDILVNNNLQEQREVPAGPFTVSNVPVLTGTGEVQVVVRDVLGRETIISRPYYAAPQILRRGLHDYSYEAGFLREGFGLRSNDYGEFAVSGTHRYGFTDRLTVEVHAEASADTQVAGAAAGLLLPYVGLLDASLAVSHSDHGTGVLGGVGFEHRSGALSFGARAEVTTDDYRNLGLPEDRPAPSRTVRAFVGLPVSFGSLGASYLLREERGDGPDIELIAANASIRLGALGSLHVSAQHLLAGRNETRLALFLAVPLGGRTSASAGVEFGPGGALATASVQRNLPFGEGFGYRAAASYGTFDRVDGSLTYQSAFGSYDAEVTWIDGKTGARAALSGAVGIIGKDVFASRRLTQSFAAVRVGEFEGVRVYADNQLVATTNSSGLAVIPRLRPYERNVIRIDTTDLPWDATVLGGEKEVSPYQRSGVMVDFEARQAHGAIVKILLADGTALPAGAAVRIRGSDESFVSAPGGEAYLTGLADRNSVEAEWGSRRCRFVLPFAHSEDPQPRLGPFTCREEQG
jgi:outer membrane usher protein